MANPSDVDKFLKSLFGSIAACGFEIQPNWDVDHICYRVATEERYREMKNHFGDSAEMVAESQINGRPISTFRFHRPIRYGQYKIELLELPAPKKGQRHFEGFEHIEIVCDRSFSEMVEQYPNLNFNKSGLAKAFNQELELTLAAGAVKFHHLSLASVVEFEKHEAWAAIERARLLAQLADYQPLIAGTIPLGVATDQSDVDILLYARDLSQFRADLEQKFGGADDFSVEETKVEENKTVIARLSIDGHAIELFAQNVRSVEQRAYQHFLVEEKILKYGGDLLKKKIQFSREKGLKTEAAFAQTLGLKGDPFIELLRLQKLSIEELQKLTNRM